MSVDLEDYYCDLPFSQWNQYPERIIKNTKKILDLFEKYNVQSTFFSVGYVAEKHPELIEEIVKKGHEIASHSYAHIDLRKVTPEEFEKDLTHSIHSLEKISGEKIYGFRAPFFSINESNFWIFKILKKYLRYDSSIFPVKTPLYGLPNAPRNFYKMSSSDPLLPDEHEEFTEFPMTTLRFPILGNIPIAGGFHLRFLPLPLIKFGINQRNKKNHSCMIYIHPKDIDANMPKVSGYAWHYYWGLRQGLKKLESLIANYKFISTRDFLNL